MIRAGHFGLVVGSKASSQTWPTVAQWVKWLAGEQMPEGVVPMGLQPDDHPEGGVSLTARVTHGATAATEMVFGVARSAAEALASANKNARTLVIETARTLPRLARLGQVNDHTRISLGRIMSEQAHSLPNGEALLFDGRVHTYEAVDRRINNVVNGLIDVGVRQGARVGVLMDTRPSALVAIAALSRLGAVAVLLPEVDVAEAARLGGVAEIIADPSHPRWHASSTCGCWFSAAARAATSMSPRTRTSSTWRRSTPTSSNCPAGTDPTRAWPATWHSSPSARSVVSGWPARSPISDGRCRRSAPRPRPTSAAVTRSTA